MTPPNSQTPQAEQWRVIPSHPSYQVSNVGTVKKPNGQISVGSMDENGYMRVCLKGKNWKSHTIHRLVMQAFVGQSKMHVDHINEDKADNRLENLEYVSIAENNYRFCKKRVLQFKGISPTRRNKWQARATFNRTPIHIGTFETKEKARKAYLDFLDKTGGNYGTAS